MSLYTRFHLKKVEKTLCVIANYQRLNSTAAAAAPSHKTTKEKYGYVISDAGESKRDRDHDGFLNIGLVNLPAPLKESLKVFYSVHPKKRLTEDGMRLTRHLRNRGRPTNSTWTKYKSQNKGSKKILRQEVKQFSLEEAVKAGLVDSDVSLQQREETNNETEDVEEDIGGETKPEKRQKGPTKPKSTEYSVVRYGARETTAYVASQSNTVYAATYRALSEIKKRVPEYNPKTLLDFGSGTGMTVWAASELWRKSIKEYQCVDVSERMNDTGEFLLRGGDDRKLPLKVPNVYFKRFLPISNQLMYDVVVSSYSLTELPFRSQRAQAIRSLWNKTNDFLVIVEPGNNEGFDATLQARQFLLRSLEEEFMEDDYDSGWDSIQGEQNRSDGYIFAPCPHEETCARTYVETRDQPCNFYQKTEIPFALRNTNMKRYGYAGERFSYLILRKGRNNMQTDDEGWTRILKEPKSRNRHIICELCCSNGNIEKHVVTKNKDPYVYKALRHCLHQGDRMPLEEAKRPMNIRKPVPPKEKDE
ncbi:ribosome assembly protein METTL17, mitochondrial-like [Clytia hemisphaerica]|uniref:Methyltransferase-like protein 17, mitochondrial n=1 Tax=Clytia hemisphaerica TaxID=252671 RepID=A0A7M5X5M4_9CNID